MKPLARVLINILANSAAILIASRLLSGFNFQGDWIDLFIAGAVLGLVNSAIKPILKLLALPIIFLTLGIFAVIINITLLFLVAKILPSLVIEGFWAAFWGMIIISIVNSVILSFTKSKE